MTAQTLSDEPNFCFVPAFDVETEVQQIRIVIEDLSGHVPTALIALDLDDALSICDKLIKTAAPLPLPGPPAAQPARCPPLGTARYSQRAAHRAGVAFPLPSRPRFHRAPGTQRAGHYSSGLVPQRCDRESVCEYGGCISDCRSVGLVGFLTISLPHASRRPLKHGN